MTVTSNRLGAGGVGGGGQYCSNLWCLSGAVVEDYHAGNVQVQLSSAEDTFILTSRVNVTVHVYLMLTVVSPFCDAETVPYKLCLFLKGHI